MTTKNGIDRRDVLKTGLLGIGLALAPPVATAAVVTPTGGDMLERMRADYDRRVERLAEELKPGFLSGQFRGFQTGDDETLGYRNCPRWKLEHLIEAKEIASDADGFCVLACSPSWEAGLVEGTIYDVQNMAAECMSLDVFRIGLREGWYRPDAAKEEDPSADRLLGLESDDSEEA